MKCEGQLLQIQSFDNYIWTNVVDDKLSFDEYMYLSFPELVFTLGEVWESLGGNKYFRVLHKTGIGWISQRHLGPIRDDVP